jgi:hypothetical protein
MSVPPPSSDAERDVPHLASYRSPQNTIDGKAARRKRAAHRRRFLPVKNEAAYWGTPAIGARALACASPILGASARFFLTVACVYNRVVFSQAFRASPSRASPDRLTAELLIIWNSPVHDHYGAIVKMLTLQRANERKNRPRRPMPRAFLPSPRPHCRTCRK